MAVVLSRSLIFLALLFINANVISFAKEFRCSKRDVYSCRFHSEESTGAGEAFQSFFDDHISDEERVLSAIARAEEDGNDNSATYDHSVFQTEKFSDDTPFSDQGVGKSLPNDAKYHGHKMKLAVTGVVAVESGPSSLAKVKTARAVGHLVKQQTKREIISESLDIRSEGSQSSTVQSASIRKKTNLQKQSSTPIQRLKGSGRATANQKTSSTITPWIRRYLSSRPKDVLLPVPKDFIADGFNVAKLSPIVERIGFQVAGEDAVDIAKQLMEVSTRSFPIYRLALQLILNENEDDNFILQNSIVPPQVIHVAAEALYLMVHSRFCQSARGLDSLKRIVRAEMFGKCPRASCGGAPLLPYGTSNDFSGALDNLLCQRYCPKCGEVWIWWDSKTDGCAFGPSLCHLFLLTHGAEIFKLERFPFKDSNTSQTPFRVMGFRIHPATVWGNSISSRKTC